MYVNAAPTKSRSKAWSIVEEMSLEQAKHLLNVIEMENPVDRLKYVMALPEDDQAKILDYFCALPSYQS